MWLGYEDSNLGMPESESGALTSLAIPLLKIQIAIITEKFRRLVSQFNKKRACQR